MTMHKGKSYLFAVLLSLTAAPQSIFSHIQLKSQCHVETVCAGPGSIQKQWRQVRVDGIIGERGLPGERVSKSVRSILSWLNCD